MVLNRVEEDFVGFYQRLGKEFGMDNLLMTIFALLYVQPEPITMEKVAQKTGYSMASISNKVRSLESMGLVRRETRPGSKTNYLYMEKDFMRIFRDHLIKKEIHVFAQAREQMPEIIAKNSRRKVSAQESKQIDIIKGYHKQATQIGVALHEMLDEMERRMH